jgi:hypothetical protein
VGLRKVAPAVPLEAAEEAALRVLLSYDVDGDRWVDGLAGGWGWGWGGVVGRGWGGLLGMGCEDGRVPLGPGWLGLGLAGHRLGQGGQGRMAMGGREHAGGAEHSKLRSGQLGVPAAGGSAVWPPPARTPACTPARCPCLLQGARFLGVCPFRGLLPGLLGPGF